MAATNPNGNEKYWFDGLPFEGLLLQDEGTEKYWQDGLPGDALFPTGGAGAITPKPSLAGKLLAAGVL